MRLTDETWLREQADEATLQRGVAYHERGYRGRGYRGQVL